MSTVTDLREQRENHAETSSAGGWRGLLGTFVLAAILFALISTSFQNFQVEGSSMHPTVQDGEFLVVNKAAYRRFDLPHWLQWVPFLDRNGNGKIAPFGSPKRGDVIVFHLPQREERNLIKRVIGLPGETIEIRRGVVYINGKRLEEKYLQRLGERSLPPQKVPDDHYFVIGDERVASFDSRDWGPLPRREIIGKAWFSYWPTQTFGLIKSETPEPGSAS